MMPGESFRVPSSLEQRKAAGAFFTQVSAIGKAGHSGSTYQHGKGGGDPNPSPKGGQTNGEGPEHSLSSSGDGQTVGKARGLANNLHAAMRPLTAIVNFDSPADILAQRSEEPRSRPTFVSP